MKSKHIVTINPKLSCPQERDIRKECDNPLICLRRFRTIEEVNKKIEKIR